MNLLHALEGEKILQQQGRGDGGLRCGYEHGRKVCTGSCGAQHDRRDVKRKIHHLFCSTAHFRGLCTEDIYNCLKSRALRGINLVLFLEVGEARLCVSHFLKKKRKKLKQPQLSRLLH